MKFNINLANFGYLGDVNVLVDLAVDAEKAGWDAVFLWDHVNLIIEDLGWGGGAHVDPWIALGLIAQRTESVILGPCITPVARRRPTKLAREILTLHQLLGDRLVFGAGLGVAPSEFDEFGDEGELKVRAEMLDEGLQLLKKLWRGEDIDHRGKHYQVKSPTFAPGGVDIPIWLAATWPNMKPLRRAAQYDGVVIVRDDFATQLNPQEVFEATQYVSEHRDSDKPYQLCITASTTDDRQADLEYAQAIEEAGANWWQEPCNPAAESLDQLRARIRRGPPKT
jgi:alkanesulfonate monooxygenase SsuD/methylene tetrahydromethanopterin reductase-like flavin-dependent oxidoreductase (luciferase family)